ncbi:MAG: carboxypeptidase regulatory-like domain-containing protein [Candidatus Tectomicrobia bacterium]|uniref:Carboxypeptidase regulatory-like domain-containing protein n=1 Tax=Tectimicrobiota bacterium TaxID=2528274 RepID=A0A932CNK7_UNCTE|nr:carboxypeptidase regulatory-like domain-containing protein [Candidatus Tectomicrobia bacterium]
MRRLLTAALACCLVLGTAVYARAYEGGTVSDGGSISGEVKYAGNPPAPKKLTISKSQEVCGQEKTSPELIIGTNQGIKNAVVYIAQISQGKPMDGHEAVLEQRGCEYVPHLQVMRAGVPLRVLNRDGLLHNLHTHSRLNPPINKVQPKVKKEIVERIEQAEIILVKCDMHGWMSAVLVVADHPYYAITDENGAFKLTDVPAGTYQLKIWHETLGEQTRQVTVIAGGDDRVTAAMKERR